jgi:hypothetical protein
MWADIVKEYTEKGTMAQTDPWANFLQSKCPEKDDVRAWLSSLCIKKETLAKAGVAISAEDFHTTIISSLLRYLSNFASNLLASMCIFVSTKNIDLITLISLITKESEQSECGHTHHTGALLNYNNKVTDEALSVTSAASKNCNVGGHGNTKLNEGRKPKGSTCWNCKEQGHICQDCTKPKAPDTVNHVSEDSEDDVALGVSDVSMTDIEMDAEEPHCMICHAQVTSMK